MTAAENLARWRGVESVASAGPWFADYVESPIRSQGDSWNVDSAATFICSTQIDTERGERDSTFIATSREAMPALLEFAEAVLDLHEGKSLHNPVLCPLTVCSRCAQVVARAGLLDDIDNLAEQHLGGRR